MAYKNVNVDISITPISSYNDLNNKPSINGVELDGNLSSEELDIKVDTTDIENSISNIESKIPDEASDTNQLVDKLYVNNNFYTKNQVDQSINQKVNTSELDNYATKQQLEFKQDKLTAGDNITIENGIISSTGTSSEVPNNVYTTDNLIAGKNVTFSEVLPEGGIDEHTLACWHFDGNKIDVVNGFELNAIGSSDSNYYKFGGSSYSFTSSYSSSNISELNLNPLETSITADFWVKAVGSNSSPRVGFGGYSSGLLQISISQTKVSLSGTGWYDTSANLDIVPGEDFNHYALQYNKDKNTISLFFNGKKVVEQNVSVSLSSTSFDSFITYNYYQARIDELRISNIARYDGDFIPPTEPYTLATGQSKTAVNANVAVPTKTSELENDSGYLTELPTNLVNTDEEQTITSLKHFQGGIDLPINSEFMVANGTTVFKHNGSRLLMGATTDPLTIRSIGTPKINRDGTDYENIDSGNISEFVSTNNSSNYVLPTASTTTLGGVKVDGTTITIDGNGVISSTVTSSGENSIGGPASWGNITGDISSQSDLQEELNKKVNGVGITSVIRLTQDEYDSLQSIDENAQYIIVGETSTQGGDYISTSSVVTSLDENVTDDQIPSAKLVYDLFMSVEQQLSEI